MAIIKKKILPGYFEDVLSGKKKFEVRLNDFHIEVGDTLVLEEWDSKAKKHTGRKIEKKITYVLKFKTDNFFGQEEEIKKNGLYVLSLE